MSEEEVKPALSWTKEIMENFKQHEGWKVLVSRLEEEIKAKENTILNTIEEGDKVYTKLWAAKLERQWLCELLNKPDSLIFNASQKTMRQQAIELDWENND